MSTNRISTGPFQQTVYNQAPIFRSSVNAEIQALDTRRFAWTCKEIELEKRQNSHYIFG